MDVLKDGTHPPFARTCAINVLRRFGSRVEAVVLALIEARCDNDSIVSHAAAEALTALDTEGSRNPQASLSKGLLSDNPYVRVTAAVARWKATGEESKSLPILVQALTARERLVRRWAAPPGRCDT